MGNEQNIGWAREGLTEEPEDMTAVLNVDGGSDELGAEGEVAADCASGEIDDDGTGEGRRRRRVLAVAAVGGAILLTLGVGGAWASGLFTAGEVPAPVQEAMRTVRAAARGEAVVSIAVKAEGWKSGFGAFGYAVVDDRGKTIDEGELAPGKDAQLVCPDGTYAVSITSFPSMKGKKATWAPPASQMFQVLNGKATPATISFTLLPVDPTDEKAVEAVTASLPEGEKEAVMGHLSEVGKKTDGGASKLAPAKPQAPASGPASHAKKWGIVKEAWDERVMVTAEHDRIEMVRKPWYEEKLVREAWTETIDHPAEYAIDKIKIGVMHGCDTCGFETQDDDVFGDHLASNGHIGWTRPIYEEHKVLVKDAWTETISHPAEYQTVHHPAETKTVHYDAVYKTVHHDAVYGWI